MALRIQHHFRLSTAFSTRLTASGRLTPHVWRRMLTSQLPEHRKHDKGNYSWRVDMDETRLLY
jgi:hypothetical protein